MNKLDLNKYQHDSFVQAGNGGSYLVKNFIDEISEFDSGAAAKFQHNSVRIIPQSNLSNIFNGSAQQLDYQINRGQTVCHFDSINLHLIISNTGANTASLLASHFMIDYIEVLMGGGTIETIYNHNLLYNELYLQDSDEEVYNNRAVRNYAGGIQGTSYIGPPVLAAGATREFFVEVPCVFSKTGAFIPAIDQTIGFRVHFASSALATTSLATTVILVNADMLIQGKEYNDVIKQKLLARYKTYDHCMPYYEPQRTIIPGQTIQSTTKTNVKITEFGGMLSSQIVVLLVPAGATSQNLYSFGSVQKLDILRNGMTVSSYQDQPAIWIKQQMAKLFHTTAPATENIYVITQSCYPVESADLGVQRGGVFMTNNDILEIQASIQNTYDVYVLCYRFCNATITKTGQFLLQPVVA
jgi:hypothetical protein